MIPHYGCQLAVGWYPTYTKRTIGTIAVGTVPPVSVTTNSASSITTSSATLNGSLDSTGGLDCQIWYEYGTSVTYGQSTPTQSTCCPESFSAPVTGLAAGTTYHFRAAAANGGTAYGADMTFTTSAPPNAPPNQPSNDLPVNGAPAVSLPVTLQSSAFSDPGDTHAASQWQVRRTAGDYSSPVFDSGTDSTNLGSKAIPSGVLDYYASYFWRVSHQDSHGEWSSWSTETYFDTLNTGVGSLVTVDLGTTVVMFDNVAVAGQTSVTVSSTFPGGDFTGFSVAGNYYDIDTTAGNTGPVTITLLIPPGTQNPQLVHRQLISGKYKWVKVKPITVNPDGTITGTVDSLSWFAVAEETAGAGAGGAVPLFPNWYAGMAAVAVAGALGYLIWRRRLAHQEA